MVADAKLSAVKCILMTAGASGDYLWPAVGWQTLQRVALGVSDTTSIGVARVACVVIHTMPLVLVVSHVAVPTNVSCSTLHMCSATAA